jgi:hypothetical protein
MEETCLKSIKGFTDEEISQLIVEMQLKGWFIKAVGKEAIHFARLIKEYAPNR